MYVIFVLFLLYFRAPLFNDALRLPGWKGLASWLSFVMSTCEVVIFPMVSWVRCDARLYQLLIFALFSYFVPQSVEVHYTRIQLSQCVRFPTMWYVRPAKDRSACAYAQSDQSLCSLLEYSMTVKLLTQHILEVLSLTGGCTSSSESTLVKISHCWKLHAKADIYPNTRIFSGEL